MNNDLAELPNSANLPFVEGLYADFIRDHASVSPEWGSYFESLENGDRALKPPRLGPHFKPSSLFNPPAAPRAIEERRSHVESRMAGMQDRVDQLIRSYRFRGHLIARVNPLGFKTEYPPELNPAYYGFTPADMERLFSSETISSDEPLTLGEILDLLWNTYCRSIGVEYMHIDDPSVRKWLQERMEPTQNRLQLSRQEQVRILTRLTDAVTFEEFIHKKFVGAKSFSLEGSESLIPLLDLSIEKAGNQGVQEIVLGMAHRGRLNVLANIMGKRPQQIFREFADAARKSGPGHGDVKYHLGYSSDWYTASRQKVHLSLCFNPSHLEFVDPVVLGRVRSKQDRVADAQRNRGMALLIHGDAAFIGQGVIQEILNLSQLSGYTVGGTLHVIVNNQIGFTTGPTEGRSTVYATDVAKMLQIPIFHVNGEDPEAVAQVVNLALDFRYNFKRDVVIDMYSYRRLGHNEGDEPSFTQPVLYHAIAKRKPVREGYLDHLLKLKGVTRQEADEIATKRQEALEQELSRARVDDPNPGAEQPGGVWTKYQGGPEPQDKVETGVNQAELARLLIAQTELPKDFHPHPKIKKLLDHRRAMASAAQPLDWSAAESLAFATLAVEGHRVRLSGQDSARGTFSQRHAVLHDYSTGLLYCPLRHLSPTQGPVDILNSPLSETGVLGFEYGYSLDCPEGLILWEAQFGDFWNVAQVIVDQFIASAEDKWRRLSGVVLLLPHGFEGQGPEHSSARLERFLALAAEDNIQVVNPTTPAQYFHCLRRQVLRPWRKPLVIMTPKSLLRHPKATSPLDACASGSFQPILPDPAQPNPAGVKRIVLCSGRIYYDLDASRTENGRSDVAIIRLEQLYPLPRAELESALSRYPAGTPVVWVQEEPENMGAWRYLLVKLGRELQNPFSGVYRESSASPAAGSASRHKREQADLVKQAFAV
jgi:2-oxoglutarate dehydrogenase E1 component